jgi:ankyrin repeat protein
MTMEESEKPALFSPGAGKLGMTELHAAAHRGDVTALIRLLETGMDPNQVDEYCGYTALHWVADMAAVGGASASMVRALAAHGADLDMKSSLTNVTAMWLAYKAGSWGGDEVIAELMLLGQKQHAAMPEPPHPLRYEYLLLDQRHVLVCFHGSHDPEYPDCDHPPQLEVLRRKKKLLPDSDRSWSNVTKTLVPKWARHPSQVTVEPASGLVHVTAGSDLKVVTLCWKGDCFEISPPV